MNHFLTKVLQAFVFTWILLHASGAAAADNKAEGLAAWHQVHVVFSHPRCANCHVGSDNIPMWSGKHYGDKPRPHGMNINAGNSRIGVENGLTCQTCHAQKNSAQRHGPPGNPVWLLAPVEMQWFGKSSREICEQAKDPKRNGNRTLEKMAHHVEDDALVGWGWNPGGGRDPAPYSAAETAAALRAWAKAGAPCPEK